MLGVKKRIIFLVEIRLSLFRQFFLAMRVKHKKVLYIYKEYEKVIKLRKKQSHTVKINIKYPKNGDFLANKIKII